MKNLTLVGGTLLILAATFIRETYGYRITLSNLDEKQKAVIKGFRAMVENDLPNEYMKEDTFLLRFLSAKDFNLRESLNYLKKILAWRKAENVDSILEEDWSDYEQRFPYDLSSVNKKGRPVLYVAFGKWDVSKEIDSSEDVSRILRFGNVKMLEDADRTLRRMREETNNTEISQYDIIVDAEGYSLETLGCFRCLQVWRQIMQDTEAHYRGAGDNVFFINVPYLLESIYPWLASALLEERSRESIRVLGGRDCYEPVLLQHIGKEQWPKNLQ